MQIEHVKSSAWKHHYIMHLIKKIINGTKGMGMCFIKFHILTHLTSNILDFPHVVESLAFGFCVLEVSLELQ